MDILAHSGEAHDAATAASDQGLLDSLTHQPVWLSMIIIAFFLFGVYQLLDKVKVKPLNRVLAMVPLLILIAILYLEHNPTVTTVVLSVGFIVTFFLAFTMISSQRDAPKHKKTEKSEETEAADEGNSE